MKAGTAAVVLALAALSSTARAGAPLPPPLHETPEPADRTLLNDTTHVPLIEADVKPLKSAGWLRQTSSLLFYDRGGNLASEIPLRTEDDGLSTVREKLGGAAPNGRFAWTLERATTWNADRSKVLSSRRLLRVYGDEGKALWESSEADTPEKGDPVAFSGDGETLLVSLRGKAGWTVSIRNYLGATLLDVGPLAHLQLMRITPSGKYAMIRWVVPDQSATTTFVQIVSRTRHDMPSSDFSWTTPRVDDDGKVYAGKRLVFDFAAPAPAAPVKPAP